eukprot:TRINITY_DN31003_c0_g1_i1.p1 TRINITY_DN31003_c0_g1~~TRINITY_DN31003_c0_g1_i1.p1  ORF type:complete len:883 (-),score=23.37 TRINITY_DN31003_c0_g1_i1:80-2728(-)
MEPDGENNPDNADIPSVPTVVLSRSLDPPAFEIPAAAWKRGLAEDFPALKEFSVSLADVGRLAGLGFRLWQYSRREKAAGKLPIIDPFTPNKCPPVLGVPLGGIGSGSINRGFQGDFVRWTIQPAGLMHVAPVDADQFSVRIQRPGAPALASVLHPKKPKGTKLEDWDWKIDGSKSTYYGLFPRAWTVYEEPDPSIRLTCKQLSPVIAHNYQESSYPTASFVWTVENFGATEADVSIMFSFQNGMGTQQDSAGGHANQPFHLGNATGIILNHKFEQSCKILGKDTVFQDPLSFCIAVGSNSDVQTSFASHFVTNDRASAGKLWADFVQAGILPGDQLSNEMGDKSPPSKKGQTIGAAVCGRVVVPAGQSKEIVFSVSWDAPISRFALGTSYNKRYTQFFSNSGNEAHHIACAALARHKLWETEIQKWQHPILADVLLPDYYLGALFNELYYLVDGGTVWTTPIAKSRSPTDVASYEPMSPSQSRRDPWVDMGHFAYLESLEYLMYNTYDVHFYASFALVMNWPRLELNLQHDIAAATEAEYPDYWNVLHDGVLQPRKKKGAVPHDIGNPGEDPWNKVNAYCVQDISRWKDLPSKFVLQVYRDYIAVETRHPAEGLQLVKELWPVILDCLHYAKQFDTDGDGIIENEGFPDQTYDTWSVKGCSAYSGGLWLASLTAAVAMAALVDDRDAAVEFSEMLTKGRHSFHDKLWNGDYYNYDTSNSSQSNSIMADQMAGQWYAKACGLESIVPEECAYSALSKVFEYNVKGFKDGKLGAVNGMRPDGEVDSSCMQSIEVWTGTTYGVAAGMLQQGLVKQAFETAKGIIDSTYNVFGYHFQTPEAWDSMGRYRAAAYMRPLCIWAMQWAWDQAQPRRQRASDVPYVLEL